MFQIRIFTIQKIWNAWFFIYAGNKDNDLKEEGLCPLYTNRSILYSSIFETLPLIIIQIINNISIKWNFIGIISIIISCLYLFVCIQRFPFYSLDAPISDVPIVIKFG